jgi:hypothetical protein
MAHSRLWCKPKEIIPPRRHLLNLLVNYNFIVLPNGQSFYKKNCRG